MSKMSNAQVVLKELGKEPINENLRFLTGVHYHKEVGLVGNVDQFEPNEHISKRIMKAVTGLDW